MEIPLESIMPQIKEPTLGFFTRKIGPKASTPCKVKVHKYDTTYVACLADYVPCPHCEFGSSTKYITVLRHDKPNMVRLYHSDGMAYYDEEDVTIIAAHCMGIRHPYSRASFRMYPNLPVHHLLSANELIMKTYNLALLESGISTKEFPEDPLTKNIKRKKR